MNESKQDNRVRATKPLDFSTFLISLGTSAMIQLGDAPDPTSGGMLKPDPEGARQTIDLLGLLEEKTKGNLDPTEAELLANLLNDLQLRARQLNTST